MSENQESITFISSLGEITDQGGAPGIEGGLGIFKKRSAPVSGDVVRKALQEGLSKMSQELDLIAKEDTNLEFRLEEVEVTMQITQNGKINIIVGDIGGKIDNGFRMKWKRR